MKPVYQASLAEGIDFKRPGYPDFLLAVSGMSTTESWGRWTDSNESNKPSTTSFTFKTPLPEKFSLQLEAQAFGPNIDQPITVKVGEATQTFFMRDPKVQIITLNFTGLQNANSIEIVIPKPASPKELDVKSDDTRKLGLGLIKLQIVK